MIDKMHATFCEKNNAILWSVVVCSLLYLVSLQMKTSERQENKDHAICTTARSDELFTYQNMVYAVQSNLNLFAQHIIAIIILILLWKPYLNGGLLFLDNENIGSMSPLNVCFGW